MFTDGSGSPTMLLPGRRLITHLPGSRTDMHPTGCFVVLKCPPIPTTCLSFLTRHFASRCQKRATHPSGVTTHNALPPTLSCSIAIMLQLLIHLTASSQPLTTLTKLGPPSVMLSEAVLTKFLVCEKNLPTMVLQCNLLQDKAAAKLRNDTRQRKRLHGVFKDKAKADRSAY